MSFKLESMSNRRFSEAFKREKVSLITSRKMSVADVASSYGVSKTAVYKWVQKFSGLHKTERIVVEKVSEATKTRELLKHIQKLEVELGRLHLENVLQAAIIDCGSQLLGEDLKKKFDSKQ